MDLPSMVQRSGDTLIVRSVVSGNQLYMDQANTKQANTNTNVNNNNNTNSNNNNNSINSSPAALQHYNSVLEQQLERYAAAVGVQKHDQQRFLQQQRNHILQQQQQQQHHHHPADGSTNVPASELEAKDEGLPQCKIKRNYSCSYCTYFTQNPRSHLTHLRDVHGEKIVINKCELCLYASRHFQKLVRHMKMVHGCTDGLPGSHGQPRGKRGMSREARKRKLEQSVGLNVRGSDMPSMEQVKRELQLQEQKLQALAQQQEEQKQQQQQLANSAAEALFVAAYERQLKAQRDRDLEALQAAAARAASQSYDAHAQQRQSSTSPDFQIPPAHQQRASSATPSRQIELSSSSPTGSTSPSTTNAYASPNAGHGEMEQPQNRLIKCSVCDFTTLYREQLIDHEVEEHYKTKFFRCEKCSYVTHIKARFSKHVKYHSMPMIKCVACDFRTPYKWNLDRHMKNHGGAGPFKCAACDFTADIKQSLTVHEMNHHVPPVGHAAGMSLARRRNKVGGTDLSDDFLSDSAEMLEDHFNNNNLDDYDDALVIVDSDKKDKYTDEEPTDLSQKGGSSDTSSVHNHASTTPKSKRPVPNLIPISKSIDSALNLSKNLTGSRSSLTDIASMFFSDKQLSEMLQPFDKSEAAQLSPTTTIVSTSSQNSRSLLRRPASAIAGSFFDKLKSSALASTGPNGNLVCPCGHIAKCLSESIIHRKSCNLASLAVDDDLDEEPDDADGGRLEIDFVDDDDKQSHSALNLSVTGSTRCQHCRHRCKSSADLLAHIKHCPEASRFANESYDSMSGESNAGGRSAGDQSADAAHPMENRVFVWNKPQSGAGRDGAGSNNKTAGGINGGTNASNEENSYYGVETAPGYGEVTKKMTPEEEAANSSLKKVYKCPHCSFWASTASRFHVHIVGHLNKKPFECSLCSYRSNWRWDITKHIRLKTIRDPSHKNARVLMNDETGRRNYTKYNKYITLMKVTEEDGDPKLMKSGEMTPNQVASLAFYNDSKNASGSSGGPPNGILSAQLNGIKEDITLEPILNVKSGDNQLTDDIIRLPLLATMVNAVMARQQHQQNDEGHATLITPSVTISAVKRTPALMSKASDDLIIDVSQEGNDKKTFYNCRKCSFRHSNRDAALAHVKIHYQDPNFPIVTATPMPAPKSLNAQNKQHAATPLQVAVNQSNIYMNKLLEAMVFPQPSSSANSTAANNNQQHSLLSAGLLQQAIQGAAAAASPNSPLSGLALAFAGKSPNKLATAASILEHGEQKANPNEASAQNTSSPSSKLASGGATPSPPSNSSTSLQYLLSSPRATSSATSANRTSTTPINKDDNTNMLGLGVGNNVNNNLVLVPNSSTAPPTATTTISSSLADANGAAPPHSIVTTPSTTATTANNLCSASQSLSSSSSANVIGGIIGHGRTGDSVCIGGYGASSFNSNLNDNNNTQTLVKNTSTSALTRKFDSNIQNSFPLSNQNILNQGNEREHFAMATTTKSLSLSSPSLSSSSSSATATKCTSSASRTSTQSPASASASATTLSNLCHNNNNNNNNSSKQCNNNNLLSLNSERRNPAVDPSPYRCGHCHQVSNWKHVIQRHCRLKHNGDVRIETLDRAATNGNERDAPPVYRPLGNNGNNNNSNTNSNNSNAHINDPHPTYAIAMKTLQQQQQQALHKNSNSNSNNPNSVLMSATEQLLHSPLAASAAVAAAAAANAATTQQDLNAAAAAYFAAAYRAAAASGVATEDLLLHQQLQQNDQIEITRLPAPLPPQPTQQSSSTSSATNNGNNHAATSNLAQLLEAATQQQQQQQPSPTTNQNAQNSKSKQQQCPLCPYISESKSQMNYHISLHKPTQYECQICPFVCAKKQHLSSHMRSVHHQYSNNANNATTNGPNLDFCVALKLAAATQKQQQDAALKRSPLTIDVSALKSPTPPTSASQPDIKQELLTEYQFKLISYCSKCPARYAQKHNEQAQNAKAELMEHLQAHGAPSADDEAAAQFKCEFCDYHAAHETLIQAHRHVHTPHYQQQCAELYKNCKEDIEYAAPKLMQITLTASSPKTVWIVDNELSNELLKDEQRTNSRQCKKFDSGSSLLKQQLEAGQALMNETNSSTSTPKASSAGDQQQASQVPPTECDESSTNTLPSTSASVATSDLAADDTRSNATSPALLERCLHCPFETKNAGLYKTHLTHHICISNQQEAHTCDHCDYSVADKAAIVEHTRVHFNAMEKLKSVAFFTSYDNLELSVEENAETEAEVETEKAATESAGSDDHDNIEVKPKADTTTTEQLVPVIKQEQEQEHNNNNNNEDDVINENMLKDQQLEKADIVSKNSNSGESLQESNELEPPPAKKACNKIILYKNDGHLSIKKDTNSLSESISERLRRRISRSVNNQQLNGYNHHHHSQRQEQQQQQQQHEQEASQKAILVNAKTGEVLKKN